MLMTGDKKGIKTPEVARVLIAIAILCSVAHSAEQDKSYKECLRKAAELMGSHKIDPVLQELMRTVSQHNEMGVDDEIKSFDGCKGIMQLFDELKEKFDCFSGRYHVISARFMRDVIKEGAGAKDTVGAWFICTHGSETTWAMDDLGVLNEYKQMS